MKTIHKLSVRTCSKKCIEKNVLFDVKIKCVQIDRVRIGIYSAKHKKIGQVEIKAILDNIMKRITQVSY